MNTYVFRFDTGGGARWQRAFELPSDDTAHIEGNLMLQNQASLRPVDGMALSVLRADGSSMQLLGSWTWRQGHADWTEGLGADVPA